MITDTELLTFRAITNFVSELSEAFGNRFHSLKLYNRLITKTTLSNVEAIKKHISVFTAFAVSARNELVSQDINSLQGVRISYSDRVFIDVGSVLKQADSETRVVIYKHLLSISALVDPLGKAKDVLKELNSSNTQSENKEDNLFEEIFSTISDNVKPDSNPMEAIGSLLSSGALTNIISNMTQKAENGELNIPSLIGNMQSMLTKIAQPEDTQIINGVLSMVTNNLGNIMTPEASVEVKNAVGEVIKALPCGEVPPHDALD